MKVLSPPLPLSDPSELYRPETSVKKEAGWKFRQYSATAEDVKAKTVFKTYLDMHTNQTVDFVKKKTEEWCKFSHFKCTILEAMELLNSFIDESDPDFNLPNVVHLYQTAERVRREHPDNDWLQLTGLLHDLGKVLALYKEPQWAVVGDTFPVGCAVAPSVVLRDETFNDNPDMKDPRYNTKYGMYSPNCGLDKVTMSWGHDEYMYRVLKHNKSTLPDEGLAIIRYHSFYPWHTSGDYEHLCNDTDKKMLPWVQKFNNFDLYTKTEPVPDVEALKPYYKGLIDKYCPGEYEF